MQRLIEYRPVGARTLARADVRVVAASNADLARAVSAGAFRQDLLFRLDVLDLHVPGDAAMAHRLATGADVVVQTWRPGVAERLPGTGLNLVHFTLAEILPNMPDS